MITYAIDGATGQLRRSATQDVGDAHALTGEPQGRYVFAAFGPRGGPPYFDPSIVEYAPDPASGRLTRLSEASSDPIWCRCCASWGRSGGWYWLSASPTHVYGMWYTGTYHDTYHTYVAHPVDNDGQLGTASVREFSEWDPGYVAVDADSDHDVFYKATETGGLTAHFVESDGSLRQMGASHLCLASTLGDPRPLVAVRGFLFASDGQRVCSWEGPRLAPRADLGLDADLAVAVAPRDGALPSPGGSRPIALMAMMAPSLRLFAVRDNGDLDLLDTVESYSGRPLFHPSGRFLYVSQSPSPLGSRSSLTAYSIDPQGRLEPIQALQDGGGAMAVTLPPQVRASTGPATD